MNHRTVWAYDHYRCRCDDCRAAKREAQYRYRHGGEAPPLYVDEIAVERACQGDRSVSLNGAEMAAAFAYLNDHGYSGRRIAAVLGVTDRSVCRWRAGEVRIPHSRPGRKVA